MGLIQSIAKLFVGDTRNVVAETVEVFRENAEAGAQRLSDERTAAIAQFAAEFAHARKSLFDRFVDGLNRLPRPMLALGTIGLFVSAMAAPRWFADRMVGVALIPEPMWWLMGAIVSFYFGARYQAKGQEFQRSVAETIAMGRGLFPEPEPAPSPETVAAPAPEPAPLPAPDAVMTGDSLATGETPYPDNAALADWWRARHAS